MRTKTTTALLPRAFASNWNNLELHCSLNKFKDLLAERLMDTSVQNPVMVKRPFNISKLALNK